jgi:hypothetical protein
MSLSFIHISADPRHAFQYPKFQALRKFSFARINLVDLTEGLAEASPFLAYRALTPVKFDRGRVTYANST